MTWLGGGGGGRVEEYISSEHLFAMYLVFVSSLSNVFKGYFSREKINLTERLFNISKNGINNNCS